MKDKTVTETAFDHPAYDRDRPPLPGIAMVYRRGCCAVTPFHINTPRSIGRGKAANIVIDDPGVSRVHARITLGRDCVLVTDLDSHNGTFIDGKRVTSPDTTAPFGSVLRLGKTILIVKEDVGPFAHPARVELPGLVGGAALTDVRLRIDTYANSMSPVLIEGETGTGKEVVARAIHVASERKGSFVAVNCAAIPGDLVESELFGHSKGAFSGSSRTRQGLFRAADGGTLLLDEIGELLPPIQAKLLRVLETNEVRAVGEDTPVSVDVRILAATNRDLDTMVGSGGFRGDLVHRIAVLRVRLPPLRDRREDIPELCAHFLGDESVRITAPAMEALLLRDWPGNVRELRNVVSGAALAARKANRSELRREDLVRKDAGRDSETKDAEESLESRVAEALARCGGNVTHAARELGVARSGLYELLKRLRIDPKSFRAR